MVRDLEIEQFLTADSIPLLDVRAPIEFEKARVPSALNLALFDDDQRAEVGRIYKENGREAALLKGLGLVGPKMHSLAQKGLEFARAGIDGPKSKQDTLSVRLYCWRGGMRSQSMAWLMEQVGIEVLRLEGGYKSYRNHVLSSFEQPVNLVVLSGLTGAGKTRQLVKLKEAGEQVVDLEGLANHRGSALGGIAQGEQPSVEMFENLLFEELVGLDPARRVWVEDEGRRIGRVSIPKAFFEQMRQAPAVFMDVDAPTRLELALEDYGELPESEIVDAIVRITKRLGGQNVKKSVEALKSGDVRMCAEVLLEYYDRTYLVAKSRQPRETSIDLPVEVPASEQATTDIIKAADSLHVTNC